MKFAFIDECYFSFRNKPYTAAVASLWEADALPSFRSAFIDTIGTAINCDPNQINAFPTIHAAEMAKEYDDDIKLLCFETIARLTQSDELVFVYELNLGKHKVVSQNYNDWHTHYYRSMIGEQNLSIKNSANILGRYYCDKMNYYMAVTDTASYVRNLQAKVDSGETITEFKTRILSNASAINDRFAFDEVIQLNAWPYDKRTGSGPVRYMHNITPSDKKDLAEQFQSFLGELQIYWTDKRDP
jgi:hypothetical protein